MRLCLWIALAALATCASASQVTYEGGERGAYALNDFTRMGQTFTTDGPCNAIVIDVPSWNDNEGGFTLSLYDSPERGKLYARATYNDIGDNARKYLMSTTPLPAGTHYWEISERSGTSLVGLYLWRGSSYAGGCAWLDGKPEEGLDFVSEWRYSPYLGQLRRRSLADRRASLGQAADEGLPQWIWMDEASTPNGATRWFRRVLELPAAPRSAELLVTGDDSYVAWVNGEQVAQGGWEQGAQLDIAPRLRAGRNVLAAQIGNAINEAGLLLRLRVTLDDGRTLRFVSHPGEAWRSYDREVPGWTSLDFDDSRWNRCAFVGDALSAPWLSSGNIREFSRDVFDPDAILATLRDEPPARAQVQVLNGMPRLVVNDRVEAPFFFSSTSLTDFAADFGNIGVHLLQPRHGLSDVWTGPGQYNFRGWDLGMARMLRDDPQAKFLVMMYLAPPAWWLDAHPDELVQYADGTGVQTDMFGGTRAVSFASEAWKRDAEEALRAVLQHFEGSPLRSRIVGYHLGNGIYGEWHYFGSSHMPDVSAPFVRAFGRWAQARYGTLEKLRDAWKLPLASFTDITAPTVEQRVGMDHGLFRDPARGCFVSDYFRFLHGLSADTLCHFAHVVKDETGGRVLCGAFYCYLLENLWMQEGGHLEGLRVLQCPDIDYVSNPYSYQDNIHDQAGNYLGSGRGVGGDASFRVPLASARLHGKLFLGEVDTATCLESSPDLTPYGGQGTESMAGTLKALRRDFGQWLGEGIGGWLFELAAGWYADETILAELDTLRGRLADSARQDMTPIARVAVVCQPESFFYTEHWKGAEFADYDLFSNWFFDSQNRALHRLSTPVDFLYLGDLEQARDYDLYILPNAFYLTAEQRETIRRKCCRDGHTVVWLYAPGYISPDGLSDQAISDLMQMQVREIAEPGPLTIQVTDPGSALTRGAEAAFGLRRPRSPRFAVTDPEARALGVWQGGADCGLAVKRLPDWTSVYAGAGPLPIRLLRNLAAEAGVPLYSDHPDVVYANAGYLVLVANGDGERTVALPRRMHRLGTDVVEEGACRLELKHGDVVMWETIQNTN